MEKIGEESLFLHWK